MLWTLAEYEGRGPQSTTLISDKSNNSKVKQNYDLLTSIFSIWI